MKQYEVDIMGISPLVFNTMQPELQEEIAKLKKSELKDWELKNWKKKALKDSKGNVIIPEKWLRGAFINACKHTRIVPSFATSKKETFTRYAESMSFENSTFRCKTKDLLQISAFMGARGKNSDTKVYKSFPKVDKWETKFTITDLDGRMSEEELKAILDFAGLFEGIGDFRKVNCGRFEVKSIKEI